MTQITISSHREEDTRALGQALAGVIQPGLRILLVGDLGAGKTTLMQGLVGALPGGGATQVRSPTYALCHPYATRPRIWHADLYRLEDPAAVRMSGALDPVPEEDVLAVEWANHADGMFQDGLRISLVQEEGDARRISLSASGPVAGRVLQDLAKLIGRRTQ